MDIQFKMHHRNTYTKVKIHTDTRNIYTRVFRPLVPETILVNSIFKLLESCSTFFGSPQLAWMKEVGWGTWLNLLLLRHIFLTMTYNLSYVKCVCWWIISFCLLLSGRLRRKKVWFLARTIMRGGVSQRKSTEAQ